VVGLLDLRCSCPIPSRRVLLLGWLILLLWRGMSSWRGSTICHEGWWLWSWWSCCYMRGMHGMRWVHRARLLR